jgi:hypothetical protein
MKDEIKAKLIEIHDENGSLTPQLVVGEAKSPKSILHDSFEWDNGKASDAYRLWQARQLIRQVTFDVSGGVEKREHIFFHTVDKDGVPSYQTREVLLNKPDLLSAAISRAQEKLIGVQKAFDELQKIALPLAPRKQKEKIKRAAGHVERAVQAMA